MELIFTEKGSESDSGIDSRGNSESSNGNRKAFELYNNHLLPVSLGYIVKKCEHVQRVTLYGEAREGGPRTRGSCLVRELGPGVSCMMTVGGRTGVLI